MQIDVLKIIDELREQTLKTYKGGAKLVIIQVGDDPASDLYVKSKMKELPKWNIEVELKKFDESISWLGLVGFIDECNYDKSVSGIIVQLPLPRHIQKYEKLVLASIDSHKNVDGFVQELSGGTIIEPLFQPCTPKGIMHIINHEGGLKDKVITVIGRGKTVGEPLIDMLRKEPCTLICCNSHTDIEDLRYLLATSHIIISAVGKPNLFNSDELMACGAIVIDAGISRVNGKQVGDFSHDDLDTYLGGKPIVEDYVHYTPWTNGVGKMTVAMLAVNTIDAYKMQKEEE